MMSRIVVARGRSDEDKIFTKRQIEEITFQCCYLWSDRRRGSGGGGKAVVFDVLESWWRQQCCSQKWLQLTPMKTRLLKSGKPKD